MRALIGQRGNGTIVLAALLSAGLVLFWAFGLFDGLAALAAEAQRGFQNRMAGLLRGLKTGQAGAFWGLLALAFGYGVFHAAGPGHGKVLIGGYGAGTGVRLWPLIWIALASSLAQATTAVALVYAGVLAFGWTRAQMVGATEGALAVASFAAIGLIGLWLVWRGVRGLRDTFRAGEEHHPHAEGAHGHVHGPDCGHAHGPTAAQVSAVRTWRDAFLLIGAVAIRPCSGALFLLVITWSMGIPVAGIAGAYAMALGTAAVTVGVAVLAVTMRGGALAAVDRFGKVGAVVPVLELAAGLLVAGAALQLLRGVM